MKGWAPAIVPVFVLAWTAAPGAETGAAAGTLQCPASLRVAQSVVDVSAPWSGVPSSISHRLRAAGFSDGPASEGAFLKPTRTKKSGRKRRVIWELGLSGSRDVWLSCDYDGTSATITRKVEGTPSECRVVYEEQRNQPIVIHEISCR